MSRSYRVVRLAGLHTPDAEQQVLQAVPAFRELSYHDQMVELFKLRFVYSDAFSRAMRQLGHDAYDIVWDFELVQRQWAQEHDVDCREENWQSAVLLEQIKALRPDVVYFQGTELAIPGRVSKTIKGLNWPSVLAEEIPAIKLIAMYSGFPSRVDRLKGVDLLFSGPPHVCEHYQKQGIKPILCYHAFDKEVLQDLSEVVTSEKAIIPRQFTFVGSARAPESRYWILRQLLAHGKLQAWVDEFAELDKRSSWSKFLNSMGDAGREWCHKSSSDELGRECKGVFGAIIRNGHVRQRVDRFLRARSLADLFPGQCHDAVRGLDYYQTIQNSLITFNRHTDYVSDSVGNMRMFEATGVGACLLTDAGSNLGDLFLDDYEVVTYRSIDEAIEKSKFLIENDDERRAIALRGQARTLRHHTIRNRCELIDEVIQLAM